MKKTLLAATCFAALSASAFADPITPGSLLMFFPPADWTPSAGLVEFYDGPAALANPFPNTGPFSQINVNNLTFTWQNAGTDVFYGNLGTGSNLACGSNCLAWFTDGAIAGSVWVDPASLRVWDNTPSLVNMTWTGSVSMTGYNETPALVGLGGNTSCVVACPYGWWNRFSVATLPEHHAVPGPIAGAGIPGLIAASVGLLALVRRRRKKLA